MRTIRYVLLGTLAVVLTGVQGEVGPASTDAPAAAARPAPTPDQQVAELVEAYRALPTAAKLEIEGDRIITQLNAVRGKLAPRSQEAITRVRASQTLRALVQALDKNDQESLKKVISQKNERETLSFRFTEALPFIEPSGRKWEYKVLAESYIEKLGAGELAAGLGQLGEEGWELVGFEKGRFVLKREK
jgi:hypothetical protein